MMWQMRGRWLLATVLATPLAGSASEATLLFKRDGDGAVPLAALRGGRVVPLAMDPEAFAMRYRFKGMPAERMPRIAGTRVWGYRDGKLEKSWLLAAPDRKPDFDDAPPIALRPEAAADDPVLLSSRKLRTGGSSAALSPDQMQAGRDLLERLLRDHALPAGTLHDLRGGVFVWAVPVRRGAPPLLVVEGAARIDSGAAPDPGDNVFGYFLVAEPAGSGYKVAVRRAYRGSIVCAHTSWSYLGHADLNGDGTDELLVEPSGWEYYGPVEILTRRSGKWSTMPGFGSASNGC